MWNVDRTSNIALHIAADALAALRDRPKNGEPAGVVFNPKTGMLEVTYEKES
jgi:hypothetical protein